VAVADLDILSDIYCLTLENLLVNPHEHLHRFANTSELYTLRDWLRYAVSTFTEAELTFGHGS